VKVTPLIGADGGIELNIDQTVNDISGFTTIGGNSYPIVDSREATAFINVQDGEMIVLGGLQSNQSTIGTTKMGFIWEIPIVSQLLGGRNNQLARRELLLFVRPHIIKPAEGTADAMKRINNNSSKKDINNFINDESKLPTPNVLDRFVKP
jgi:type II secretory pathway component GspD/PulD (secretin)